MYILVTQKSRHIEGDERSRTNPGHGFPAHTENYQVVEEIENDEELMKKVKRLRESYGKPEFKVYRAEKLSMNFETVVTFEVDKTSNS